MLPEEGNLNPPTPINLMPLPAIDTENQERDQRSVGEDLKSSRKEFQPLKPIKQFNRKLSTQVHVSWGITRGVKHVYAPTWL